MLELYYDCTDRFVDRKDFEFVEMDTNSTYMPLTTPLESILKPGMEREFLESRNTTQDTWVVQRRVQRYRGCCSQLKDLCPLGICQEHIKVSSKGISKRLKVRTADVYKDVLQIQHPFTGINRGFIKKDCQTVMYRQSRAGITYYYAMRQVLEDGVSTAPLDITLKF